MKCLFLMITRPFAPKSTVSGSVAIEYLIVSGFALLLSIATITWMGTIMKERIGKIAEKIHASPADMDLDIGFGIDP